MSTSLLKIKCLYGQSANTLCTAFGIDDETLRNQEAVLKDVKDAIMALKVFGKKGLLPFKILSITKTLKLKYSLKCVRNK